MSTAFGKASQILLLRESMSLAPLLQVSQMNSVLSAACTQIRCSRDAVTGAEASWLKLYCYNVDRLKHGFPQAARKRGGVRIPTGGVSKASSKFSLGRRPLPPGKTLDAF